ncbi:MAG: hypothetical protein ACW968_07610 [Candidatus Thorarchaeota archaeon]
MHELEFLEQTGALRTLLLVSQRRRYITELRRTSVNPEGVASQDSLKKIRYNLHELGLVTEEMEEGIRPKTFLVITEKGKLVAQKISEIQEILTI